jgi:hypothetical protein
MFNFLVTSSVGAWDELGYIYSRSRFLEYTSEEVAARFRELNQPQIDSLLAMPCLFAYEGTDEPLRVGRIRQIKLRNEKREIYIEFELDRNIAAIPYEKIRPFQNVLDIRTWEMNRTHWAIKEEDLFEVLTRAEIISPTANHPTVKKTDLPEPSRPVHQADSVGRFIENVLGLSDGRHEVFYRGHSKRSSYLLEPSLFRKDEAGNFTHLTCEDRMYRELLVSNSGDFDGDVYTLDRLVRAQHYSLPTRLLDITSNPLIGLYFACVSNQQEDGEVIVFSIDPSRIKYFDSDTASCIANLARLSQADKDEIDYGSGEVQVFNTQPSVKRLLHFIKEEKPFFEGCVKPNDLRSVICVKGKHTNNRISFQSGAFLLFGHDATLAEEGSEEISVQRIGVTNKAAILQQLDQLNINERTVYPNIDNSAKYIAKRFAFKK